MKKFGFVLFLVIILSLLAGAQRKPDYVGQWYQRSSQGKTPQVIADLLNRASSDFPRTKRYNLRANVNQLNAILRTAPPLLNLVIPYGDRSYTLNLARVDLTTESFSVRTNQGSIRYAKGVQYRGIVNNNPSHIASLSITPNDISAYFSTAEGNFVISKEGLEYIVYNDEVLTDLNVVYCQTPDSAIREIPVTSNLVTGIGCKTVNVYMECDYAFYQNKGSNVNNVADYVLGFFNQVATLYANENVAIQISEIFVWNSPDPYQSLTTTNDVLTSFRTNRGTNYNGNVAHFLTTRNLGGGVAYVDVLCNKAYAYGVSMVYSYYNNFPTYSWTVNVVAHEIGHNLGSAHTHSCSWSIGALDNCYTPEGSCATGPAPVNGGTVMSYCHLTSMGINFNNGFGFHPGNRIRERVSNATCISGSSATAPTGLYTSNITSASANLSWIASPGASSYSVQYKAATAATWTQAGNTSNTFIDITGLTAGVTYQWTVKSDCSEYASSVSFTTTPASGCSAPSNLNTTGIGETFANVNWSPVAGAVSYTVQYRISASSTWASVNTTSTSQLLSGLNPSTSYTWQVKADCSPYSNTVSFSTTGTTGCSAPANLVSTNVSSSSATLSWSAVAGATGYTLQYRPTASSEWISVNTTASSVSLNNLTPGTAYTWQVKADCSSYAAPVSFTTSPSAAGCSMPGGLSESNVTSSSATLNWSPVSNAQSYSVRIRESGGRKWTNYNNIRANYVNVTRLRPNRSYEWIIQTHCTDGSVSGFSTGKTFNSQ